MMHRNRKPDISFGMLTWNRAPMLRDCLKSFFAALDPSLSHQIVIIDNGSTDGTRSVLEEYRDHPEVTIVYNGKNEHFATYKKLFPMLKADILVDVDDDVIEFPQHFDRILLEYMAVYSDYGFLALNVVVDEKTTGARPTTPYVDDVRYMSGRKMVVEEGEAGGWCAAFRRRHFRLIRPFFNLLVMRTLFNGRIGGAVWMEDAVINGFVRWLFRKRVGIIRDAVCLHADSPYYAKKYSLLKREMEKYERLQDNRNCLLYRATSTSNEVETVCSP